MQFHGSLDNPKSKGTNNLLKEIAKIATDPQDIIQNYDFLHKVEDRIQKFDKEDAFKEFEKETSMKIFQRFEEEKSMNIFQEYNQKAELDENLRSIYKIITNNPIDINTIAKKSNFSTKDVMQKLTMLELQGMIKRTSGGRYVRKEDV